MDFITTIRTINRRNSSSSSNRYIEIRKIIFYRIWSIPFKKKGTNPLYSLVLQNNKFSIISINKFGKRIWNGYHIILDIFPMSKKYSEICGHFDHNLWCKLGLRVYTQPIKDEVKSKGKILFLKAISIVNKKCPFSKYGSHYPCNGSFSSNKNGIWLYNRARNGGSSDDIFYTHNNPLIIPNSIIVFIAYAITSNVLFIFSHLLLIILVLLIVLMKHILHVLIWPL